MLGWWEERNGVTVDRPQTYVTAFRHPLNGVLLAVATWHEPLASWMEMTFDVTLRLDRRSLGLPGGRLGAADILTGDELDLDRPIPLHDLKSGRRIWVRGVKPG